MIAMTVIVSRQLNGPGLLIKRFTEICLAAFENPAKAQGASFEIAEEQWCRLLELWKYNSFADRERPLPDVMKGRKYVRYDDSWHFEILASLEEAHTEVFGAVVAKEQVVDSLHGGLQMFHDLRVISDKALAEKVKAFFTAFLVKLTGT